MTDKDCLIIQSKAIAHLLQCGFDDFSMSALDLGNVIKDRFEEAIMND